MSVRSFFATAVSECGRGVGQSYCPPSAPRRIARNSKAYSMVIVHLGNAAYGLVGSAMVSIAMA